METVLKTQIINQIIEAEGDYVNDPSDSGGETRYGITRETAIAYGYAGPVITLPRELAFMIYKEKYWDTVAGDTLAEFSERIAAEVVDTAVNMGPSAAATFLQRCLNVFNDRGRLYPDLVIDGRIGQVTLRALSEYLSVRDEAVLVKALNCLQGTKYIELAERREKDERFVYGWIAQRVNL